MSLPAPELDDRRFQDIVDEAKRLIPRYCPEWTNHNLTDPGVALIELFAWMTEMFLFRLNQVPDRYFTKFLELVGVAPFPPSVATTDVTFLLATVLDEPVAVPAGTEVSTTGAVGGDEVVFSTVADLEIRQPALRSCMVSAGGDEERYVDVWDALRYEGGVVTCFPSSPLAPDDAVLLGFETSLAGNVVRLAVQASIEGIGVDPRDPPLAWEVWTGELWVACRVDSDSTGGLNRDGYVVLHVPMAHAPLTLGTQRAYWLRARLTQPASGQPWYQASPQLRNVEVASLGGTVGAEHAELVATEVLGRADGGPGLEFKTSRSPVLPRRPGEHVEVRVREVLEVWEEVADFSRSGPTDRHVVWDGASGTVHFGPMVRYPNGTTRQHGAIPADGAVISVSGYRHGGGARGNLGAGTLTTMRSTIPFIDRIVNNGPAVGGVDAETVENAKVRGPLSIRTGERAVTAGDFERLTLEASAEVARVRCLPPKAPADPVRLLVVPQVRKSFTEETLDDYAVDDDLMGRISGHLDSRRLLGAAIEVGTPFYQGVSVAALVQALPGRPATLIRDRALDLLRRFVHPLQGGVEGKGWPFDTDLNAATLAQLLEGVDGVDRVEEVLLFEFDLRTGQRSGAGREVIRLAPDSLFLSAGHQVVVR
jgi:predicted phage baseplate assembly protein